MLPQENEEENDEDIVGDDWMKAPLTFESDGPVLAKDASSKVVIRRRKNQLWASHLEARGPSAAARIG